MKKLKLVSSIALMAGALAAPVHAETETQVIGIITLDSIQGGSSNTEKVIVGASNVDRPPIHTLGKAGIGAGYTLKKGDMVDFIGLAKVVPADPNRVHSLDMAYYGPPKTHRDLGVFQFAQVGSHDVWFGEWSQTGASNDPTRTVYYVGADADTAITTTARYAIYTVTGINHYSAAANNLLHGVVVANFTNSVLTGKMEHGNFKIDMGTVWINSSDATFLSSQRQAEAFRTNPYREDLHGIVSGRFYNGQVDLAGMVTFFSSPEFNTAFGGSTTTLPGIIIH